MRFTPCSYVNVAGLRMHLRLIVLESTSVMVICMSMETCSGIINVERFTLVTFVLSVICHHKSFSATGVTYSTWWQLYHVCIHAHKFGKDRFMISMPLYYRTLPSHQSHKNVYQTRYFHCILIMQTAEYYWKGTHFNLLWVGVQPNGLNPLKSANMSTKISFL